MKTNRLITLLLLIAIPVIAYANSLQNTFVYDDVFTITDNYFIRDWGNLSAFFTHDYFQSSGEVTYRPVVTLSYFIDYSIWRLNPAGFHLTNILLHTLNGILVYKLLLSMSRNKTVPFLGSILFALHPVLTEVVNGISYREDLLTTTFYLGAVLLFIRYATGSKQSAVSGQRSAIRNPGFAMYQHPLSLVFYFLALCSKEMAITMPLSVFLIDWFFGGKSTIRRNLLRYYPGFILVSVFYLFLRFVWLHNPVEKQLLYPDNSFLTNVLTMPKVISSYVTLLFFPFSLHAEYSINFTKTPYAATFVMSVTFLGILGLITYKCYYHSRFLFFSLLWFFVTLSPMMNIMPIANIMAERYLYLPSVGFCALLAGILTGIPKRAALFFSTRNCPHFSGYSKSRGVVHCAPTGMMAYPVTQPSLLSTRYLRFTNIWERSFGVIPIVLLMLVLTVPYSLVIVRRNRVWSDPFTFWSRTAEESPNSSRAHNNLGMIYYQKGKTDTAIHEFRTAIALESDPEYHHNLGMAYQSKGMEAEALQEYNHVLAVNPNSALTHNNIGNILVAQGNIDEGILRFQEAIRLKPNYYDAHYNLGLAYFKKGLLDASGDEFKLAISYEPDHAEAHSCLGTVYANKGLFDEAIVEIEEALRKKPDYPNACKNLGIIYLNYKKDAQKALHFFEKFLRLDPANPEAETVRKTVGELQSVLFVETEKNKD